MLLNLPMKRVRACRGEERCDRRPRGRLQALQLTLPGNRDDEFFDGNVTRTVTHTDGYASFVYSVSTLPRSPIPRRVANTVLCDGDIR